MEDPSPPKRVTRARAAKVSENSTIRVATAASRAKAAPAVTKRRTRADDTAAASENTASSATLETKTATRTTRTRARKPTDTESETTHDSKATEAMLAAPPVKATRGRVRKTVEEPAQTNAEPTRPTRSRPRKVESSGESTESARPASAASTARKTTRVRGSATASTAASSSRAAATVKSASAAAPALKKSVKFDDEPGKENIMPSAAAKAKAKTTSTSSATSTSGMRARPVRRPVGAATSKATTTNKTTNTAAPATRGVRSRTKVSESEQTVEKTPLSPKKSSQVTVAKDTQEEEGEEEKAEEEQEEPTKEEEVSSAETPLKPMMKSPIKPPASALGTVKKLDVTTSILAQPTLDQPTTSEILNSPARRQAASSFQNAFKMSPRRPDHPSNSPFKNMAAPKSGSSIEPIPFKSSLLQTPAKRPPSPIKKAAGDSSTKTFSLGDPIATPRQNALHISRFATTPRTLPKSVARLGHLPVVSPLTEKEDEDEDEALKAEIEAAVAPPGALASIPFTGRLSSVLPRTADPALNAEIQVPPSLLGDAHPMHPEEPEEQIEELLEELAEEIAEEADPSSKMFEEMPEETEDVENLGEGAESATEEEEEAEEDDDNAKERPQTPGRVVRPYELRDKDADPFYSSESESEDEASASPRFSGLRMSSRAFANMSTPKRQCMGANDVQNTVQRSNEGKELGFTPLAHQLSKWLAASPEKSDGSSSNQGSPLSRSGSRNSLNQVSPTKSTFFDDEMSVLEAEKLADEQDEENEEVGDVDLDRDFAPPEVDDADYDLAAEADCMSVLADEGMLPEESEEEDDVLLVPSFNSSVSEASQEYGDENAAPAETALMDFADIQQQEENIENQPADEPAEELAHEKEAVPMATPVRPLRERVVHTVSKVPLKPAAPESPFYNRGCATVSRIPSKRPAQVDPVQRLPASTGKRTARRSMSSPTKPAATPSKRSVSTPIKTPSRNISWSSIATPAATPRRDVNPTLLKGAVVFVDVHTTEGADASSIFVELLTQMGAKCVKTWGWNPSSSESSNDENGSHSKIGITHVVFKDGSKRTMEKVRESNGVVSCVGVGWVLDCERESKWLDEAPYAVDNAFVPRGGRNRRKSMEPKSLENHDGTVVNSTPRASLPGSSASSSTSPSKANRRDSSQWVRTPLAMLDESNVPRTKNDDSLLATTLSPVPRTPAPEDIAAFAASLEFSDSDTPESVNSAAPMQPSQLIQMTVPAKRVEQDWEMDEGSQTPRAGTGAQHNSVYNESVMARLMLARRKSQQFVPKVGSPLSKRYY